MHVIHAHCTVVSMQHCDTLVQKWELGSEGLLLLSTLAISVHCSIPGTACTLMAQP